MPLTGAALDAIRAALGPDAVDATPETLDRYARSTSGLGTRPTAVCYPTTTEEVQALVRAAVPLGAVLYPVSGGRNWGYGDACAPTEGAVIVDLGRMNQILEINDELAYCVIEPGVTQGQLYAQLQERGGNLWMDATGAGLDASLMGNTLDRGFGHTRHSDHFQTSCGMEIVLADGRILRTGFAHYDAATAASCYRHGVGPALDGLFTQSNFGIVTRVALWLMPKPEAFCFYFVRAYQAEALPQLVDALRPLRLDGTLDTSIHIANDLRLLSATQRYPWGETGGLTPLPHHLRQEMRRRLTAGSWTVSGSLAGSPARVRDGKRRLRKALRHVGRVTFINDALLHWGAWAARRLKCTPWGKRVATQLSTLTPNYNLLRGVPTNAPLQGVQWRLREAPPTTDDPRDTHAGILWLSPVLPARGTDAAAVMGIVGPLFDQYGLDPLITFTFINERSLVAVINAAFDRSIPEECVVARQWYEDTADALIAAGYIPYRTSPHLMPRLRPEGDVFWEVTAAIKQALDPADAIARGRYVPPLSPGSADRF